MSDNHSGSPIFPAEGPYGTPPQRPAWADAEPTAMLPPVPPQAPQGQPQQQAWDPNQPPPSSSFSQIHEKYATTEAPLPPQAFEQPQPAGAAWPEHWTQSPPAAQGAPAPPPTWQPQQPPQQPAWNQAEQTTLLPPVPTGYDAPGYATPGYDAPGYAAPGYDAAPPYQQAPPQAFGEPPYAEAPYAEQTTLMPPVPADYGVPPQQVGYAPAPPGAQPYPPQPSPSGPSPELLVPGAGGWNDAPLAYGTPSTLREAFAAAQPTGPAGPVAPPPPPPLDVQHPGGSLREAFASAQPTGPTAPGYAQPAQAVPGPGVSGAPGASGPAVRTGSPIIDPGIQPAAATLALAVLLALAALLGRFGLVLPVLLLQAVTAAGWFRLNGMWPARQGIALAALGGFAADAAALAASGGTAPAVLAGTLGGFFLLVLILQIFRPSNPDERFYALTVSASATVMTVLVGCFLAAVTIGHHGWSTGAAVVVGALAAGVATAVSALPKLPANIGFVGGAFAALVVGAVLGALTGVGLGGGLLLGLAAGVCALVGRRVAAYDFPSRFVHLTAGVVLPLACAAPGVFLVAHLLAG